MDCDDAYEQYGCLRVTSPLMRMSSMDARLTSPLVVIMTISSFTSMPSAQRGRPRIIQWEST